MSSEKSKIVDLNIALAHAVGITCTDRLAGFELKVSSGTLPLVRATFLLKDADGLRQVVHDFQLTPTGLDVSEVKMAQDFLGPQVAT